MHIALKIGAALTAVAALGAAVHPHAFAAEPAAIAQNPGVVAIPPQLEAHIRAMVRAHAPAGQAQAAEIYVLDKVRAHLAEVAKDPAKSAQANQMLAQAAAGDPAAVEHINQMIVAIAAGAGSPQP